ncbi:MAG: bifunctional 4-hydroxy-3-methylbut-2-enyl diphosphate reductase/30S ribosomal protein S1 [Clostridia bacterium]|nr:bifunctional 4-hydroxy-3-methylbut-2-enyl diphosphate reductase/30S ribosomal protein S1 [Clostridia bacterium]
MEIKLAKTAGFCFGVNRAVKKVYSLLDDGKSVATLGPIIHNTEMVNELKSRGAVTIDKPSDTPEGATVVVRSHGVSRRVMDEIQSLGLECCDATCPFVSKIHSIVAGADPEKNKSVFIAGDENHPEVQGIMGHAMIPCYTYKDNDELNNLLKNIPQEKYNSAIYVAQTTFSEKEWKKCFKTIKKVCTNPEIFDTICSATHSRQAEAENLAADSDFMIVIGDKKSSNTSKLFELCSRVCKDTLWIQTADDLPTERLSNACSVGVTAGASTPARIIKEVLDKMAELTTSGVTNETEDFEALLEENLKGLNTNERVMGTVISITPTEVYVDVGRKQAGFIPAEELSFGPVHDPADFVKVGDEIELLIMKTNDVEGTIMLSKRRVDAKKDWDELEKLAEENAVLSGEVIEVVNGGVIVFARNNRVFIPASQASMTRMEDLTPLLHTEVEFRLLEVSQRGRRKKIVGSIKSVLRDQRSELKAAFWENIEVGKTYTGTVKSLTTYGAFVDLGGVFGMIHISELSWTRIKHPSEVVNVGDTVEVYVKDFNTETSKISLGFKKAEDNPWEILRRDYPVDSVATVKIAGITTFGAFATIIPGIDGLIHISQLANKHVEKPQDVVSVGDELEAKIVAIDFDKKRVSLSVRALLPEAEVETAPVEEEVVAVAEAPATEEVAATEEATEE